MDFGWTTLRFPSWEGVRGWVSLDVAVLEPALHGLKFTPGYVSVGVAPGVVQVELPGVDVVGGDRVGMAVDDARNGAVDKPHGQHLTGVDQPNRFTLGHSGCILGGCIQPRDLVDHLIHPAKGNARVGVGIILTNPALTRSLGHRLFQQGQPTVRCPLH